MKLKKGDVVQWYARKCRHVGVVIDNVMGDVWEVKFLWKCKCNSTTLCTHVSGRDYYINSNDLMKCEDVPQEVLELVLKGVKE